MPFARAGRSIDIAAGGKALPQVAGQHRRRRLTPLVGRRQHALLDARAQPVTPAGSTSPAFDGAKTGAAPPVANLGFTAAAAQPTGRIALTGARIVTMQRRRGDRERHRRHRGRPHRRGRPRRRRSPSRPARAPSTSPARPSSPASSTPTGTARTGRTASSPSRIGSTPRRSPTASPRSTTRRNDTERIFAAAEYQKAGKILGPRIFSTGTILYGATTPFMAEIDSLDDALAPAPAPAIRRLVGQELQPAAPRAAPDDHRRRRASSAWKWCPKAARCS